MPPPAHVSLHQETARLIARTRRAVLQSSVILQYDSLSRGLRPWHWPVNTEGERLTPEALELLQASADRPEDFKAPCCVCPYRSGTAWDLECEITMVRDGYYVGEYVARCAMEACKYLMPLDRLYNRPGLLVHKYDFNAGQPPYASTSANNATTAEPSSPASQSERAAIHYADIGDLPSWLPQSDPVDSTIDRLLRLNKDGLRVSEFVRLFAKCSCGRVMTRKCFEDHTCIPVPSE